MRDARCTWTGRAFFLYRVKLKFTIEEESHMEPIADDPIVACMERTGYPPWMRA